MFPSAVLSPVAEMANKSMCHSNNTAPYDRFNHGTQACWRKNARDRKAKPRKGAQIGCLLPTPRNAAHTLHLSKVADVVVFNDAEQVFEITPFFLLIQGIFYSKSIEHQVFEKAMYLIKHVPSP